MPYVVGVHVRTECAGIKGKPAGVALVNRCASEGLGQAVVHAALLDVGHQPAAYRLQGVVRLVERLDETVQVGQASRDGSP